MPTAINPGFLTILEQQSNSTLHKYSNSWDHTVKYPFPEHVHIAFSWKYLLRHSGIRNEITQGFFLFWNCMSCCNQMEDFIKLDHKKLEPQVESFTYASIFFYSAVFQIVWILSFSNNYNRVWDTYISQSSIFAISILHMLIIWTNWLSLMKTSIKLS